MFQCKVVGMDSKPTYTFSFLNGPTPACFIVFQTNVIIIFTTNICEKCPFSIRCPDLNPRPLGHESPPITTRPGLLSNLPTYTFTYCKKPIYQLHKLRLNLESRCNRLQTILWFIFWGALPRFSIFHFAVCMGVRTS